MLLEQVSNGIALGSIYALTAIGYTLVYGIISLINFAHGDIYMMGAFYAMTAVTVLKFPIIPAFVVGMLGAALTGFLIARFAYKPVFGAPRINLFLCAVGVAYLLENFAMLVWGPETKVFPLSIDNPVYHIAAFSFSKVQVIIITVSIALVLALNYIVKYTRMGRAMRCVSQNMDVSRLMGVNTDRIVFLTFMLGSALGAAAGILVGIYYNALYPMMGFVPGLKAFIAAVIGGVGSIPGAMVGGMIMGLSESLGAAYVSSGYRDAIAYVILIVILLVRPQGLLGKTAADKI